MTPGSGGSSGLENGVMETGAEEDTDEVDDAVDVAKKEAGDGERPVN